MNKINKLKNILLCPKAKTPLVYKKKFFYSKKNKKKYYIISDKIYFNSNKRKVNKFVNIKDYLKNTLGSYYYFILKIFGPTYPFNIKREITKYIDIKNYKLKCLDIGSGNLTLNKDFINLDFYPYEKVDVVGDAKNLPFKNKSLDFVYSKSFLEHSDNPEKILDEIYRVMKPKSFTIHSIPFMYPYHASPFDYNRYTEEGLKILFKKFKIIKIINISGPFTLINLILIEIVNSFFSLINKNIATLCSTFLMFLISPFKYLDIFFVKNKYFSSLAPNYLIIAKKN